jgi:cytoplasmic iron level regulating protein YaaA (DUF328/UPF0246 family)
MAELILIPCSSSKNHDNQFPEQPIDPNDVINQFDLPSQVALNEKREILSHFANPLPGFSNAYIRYNGPHAWQFHIPENTRQQRNNPNMHVLIVSAYYGILNPYSPIQDYDLAMQNQINFQGEQMTVKQFWMIDHFLHTLLENYCTNNNIDQIHNLLTLNYQQAVELNLPINGVQIINHQWNDNYGHHRGHWLATHL